MVGGLLRVAFSTLALLVGVALPSAGWFAGAQAYLVGGGLVGAPVGAWEIYRAYRPRREAETVD